VTEFHALPESLRRALSRHEFARMLQWGLWLEALFIEQLGREMARGMDGIEHEFRLHEAREEAGHGLMFLRLLREAECEPAPFKPDPGLARLARLARHLAPGSVGALTARLIGADVPDKVNRHIRAHGEGRICPLLMRLVTWHVIDEARHVAHARHALESGLRGLSPARRAWPAWLARRMLARFARGYFYPAAEVYEAAGLAPGAYWRGRALANPCRQAFVQSCVGPVQRQLGALGLNV
jgi:hypothetical protein